MKISRRDALKVAAAVPTLGAAKGPPPLPPIVTSGGVRLYPTWDPTTWWTSEPLSGWDLPQAVSLGASLAPDGATAFQDIRNTPLHGPFTRAYFQFSTRPLNGAQSLDGVFSAAFHAIEWHKRIDAVLAIQIVVHRADTTVRGVALPLMADALEFTVGDPPRSRAAQNWALAPVACQDGDVIAINVGIAANNQSNTLAQTVGFSVYASEAADISRLDDPQLANSWMEFSAPLIFY
jgi:hypothetical protein